MLAEETKGIATRAAALSAASEASAAGDCHPAALDRDVALVFARMVVLQPDRVPGGLTTALAPMSIRPRRLIGRFDWVVQLPSSGPVERRRCLGRRRIGWISIILCACTRNVR